MKLAAYRVRGGSSAPLTMQATNKMTLLNYYSQYGVYARADSESFGRSAGLAVEKLASL
jgi:hypothetical protein